MSLLTKHPAPGARITDRFGPRGAVPGTNIGPGLHNGIDFALALGTPVYAAASGTVYLGWEGGGFGNYVQQWLNDTTELFYAHLNSSSVVDRAHVTAGQIIGYAGKSGAANGSHLHFSVRMSGVYVNPEPYLNNIGKTTPIKPTTPLNTVGEEEMYVANVNGDYYLVLPNGGGKPTAHILGADSGAVQAGIPLVNYTWAGSVNAFKRAVNIV